MAPIDEVMESLALNGCEDGSLPSQDLVGEVVHRAWMSEFGPSRAYLYILIQTFLRYCERTDVPIESEALLELVMIAMTRKPKDAESPDYACYLSFQVHGSWLRTRVYPKHNDVGVRLWEAGAFLAEYLLANPTLVDGKRVVELGGGIGMTAIVVAGCCGAEQVHCTDYTEATLVNMVHNIEMSQPWIRSVRQCQSTADLVTSGYLEWNECAKDLDNEVVQSMASLEALDEADVILAADVLYDVEAIKPLVEVMERSLCKPDNCALVASTVRNRATFNTFVEELTKHQISTNTLQVNLNDIPKVFYTRFNQPRSDIRLFLLRAA